VNGGAGVLKYEVLTWPLISHSHTHTHSHIDLFTQMTQLLFHAERKFIVAKNNNGSKG